jgi:hypothetical protein
MKGSFEGDDKDHGGSVVCPNHFPFGSTTGIIQVNGIGNGHAAIKWLGAIEARLPVTERPV